MKTILALSSAFFVAHVCTAGTVQAPTLKQLWDGSEVVISARYAEQQDTEYQSDLPDSWSHTYQRIEIGFQVEDTLKGEIDERYHYSEENEEPEKIWVYVIIAEEKEDPTPPSEENLSIFGPPHSMIPPPTDGDKRYLVFLRRDIYGHLKPVHPTNFIHYTKLIY